MSGPNPSFLDMRTRSFLALVAWMAAGCGPTPVQVAAPPPTAPAPTPPDAVVIAPDAATPIAAVPERDAAPDADTPFALLDSESLGALKLGMSERELVARLGEPTQRTAPGEREGATGMYVTSWSWRDVFALMSAPERTGPWTARSISVAAAKYPTARGIHVGSTRAELARLYPADEVSGPQNDPKQYLAGSIYGGLLFSLDGDRVSGITMGAFAF